MCVKVPESMVRLAQKLLLWLNRSLCYDLTFFKAAAVFRKHCLFLFADLYGKLLTLQTEDGRYLEIEHKKSMVEQEESPLLVRAVHRNCVQHEGIFKLTRIYNKNKVAIKSISYDKYLSW